MQLAVKYIILLLLAVCPFIAAYAQEMYILVMGQSISANCNEHVFSARPGILQLDLMGNIVPAADPFVWADCTAGSMWMPLGERILAVGLANPVVFMPLGVAGTKAEDWLAGGRAFAKLQKALELIKQKDIQFEYAFWHQGTADIGTPPQQYESTVKNVIRFVNANVRVKKWLVAQHSACNGRIDVSLAQAQRKIAGNNMQNLFPGPDTNQLDAGFRSDGCHLNQKGQLRMAELWLESMRNSDRLYDLIQQETLLNLFR